MHKIVDVSNNNGHVNFHAVKAAGAEAVWLKVTEGTDFVDPDYVANRARARAAGLRVGGYHFGHARSHPGAEAAFFLAHLQLEPGDLLPALDLEQAGLDGQPPAVVAAYGAGFLAAVRQQIDADPVLYTGSYVIAENGLERLPGPRWLASYGAPPKTYRWAAWQFTDGQPAYPGSILHLDTSRTPALALVTYKPRRLHKAAGHLRAAAARLRLDTRPSWAWRRFYGRRLTA